MDTPTNATASARRILTPDDLRRIHTAIKDAADTRQLLGATVSALYAALDTGTDTDTGPEAGDRIAPGRYAIPASQWQAILGAMTNRAQAWGTAAEVGLELALHLMPDHYDDPAVPAPQFPLPDYRPAEVRITLTRDAVDVITACETHLGQLRGCYGQESDTYQNALHSWHRTLTAMLTMNTGSHTQVSKDGPLSLFVQTSSGLVYGIIFHAATRYCTSDGCHAVIGDDGTAPPAGTGTTVRDHQHTPSYPVGAARPGTWSLHS